MKGALGLRAAGFASTEVTLSARLVMALNSQLRLCRVFQIVLVQLFAGIGDQARLVGLAARCFEQGLDRPVFNRLESFDLHLAFDDQPQADRLHPASRFRAG